MIVSIMVNGQRMNKDELKSITIKNKVISDIIQKARKRQSERKKRQDGYRKK